MSDFETFLDGEQPPAEPVAEATTPEAPTEPQEAAKGEQDAAPPAAEKPPEPVAPKEDAEAQLRAFKARADDERRKRQQLEQQLQQLQQPKEKPDFFADPEAALQSVRSEFKQELTSARFAISEAMAKDRWQDYDAKLELFAEMAQSNPALWAEVDADSNPAAKVYKLAEKEMKLREMGDPDEYRAKLKAELRAELLKEQEEKQALAAKTRATIPESLAGVRGGGAGAAEWAGPTSLKDILK